MFLECNNTRTTTGTAAHVSVGSFVLYRCNKLCVCTYVRTYVCVFMYEYVYITYSLCCGGTFRMELGEAVKVKATNDQVMLTPSSLFEYPHSFR